MTVSTNK